MGNVDPDEIPDDPDSREDDWELEYEPYNDARHAAFIEDE